MPIAERNPDYFRPILNSDREETILISFASLYNMSDAMLYFLLGDACDTYEKYMPRLITLREYRDQLTRDKTDAEYDKAIEVFRKNVFDLSTGMTPHQLFLFLRDSTEASEEDHVLYNEIISKTSYTYTALTRLGAAVRHLSTLDLVKKIYVVDDVVCENQLLQLQALFGEYCGEKILAVRGEAFDFMRDNPSIKFTTCFFNEIEEAYRIVTQLPESIWKDIYFQINGSILSNSEDLTKEIPEIRFLNAFLGLEKDKKVQLSFFKMTPA